MSQLIINNILMMNKHGKIQKKTCYRIHYLVLMYIACLCSYIHTDESRKVSVTVQKEKMPARNLSDAAC